MTPAQISALTNISSDNKSTQVANMFSGKNYPQFLWLLGVTLNRAMNFLSQSLLLS